MKTFHLIKMSVPKIAVLATGLAAALLLAMINPAPPAQAYPTEAAACTGCHTPGGSVVATPSSATLAPGAAYTVALVFTGGTSPVGYWISGNGASVTASNGGPVSMTAPAAAGNYTYTVWMRSGTSATTTYTIAVGAEVTTPTTTTTTTTTTTSTTALAMTPVSSTEVAPAAKTLTATVTGTGAAGVVQFFNGTTSLGTSPVANGAATLALSAITAANYSYHAVFTPTNSLAFTSSTSRNMAFTVTDVPATTIPPTTDAPTSPTTTRPALSPLAAALSEVVAPGSTKVVPKGAPNTGAGGASHLR